MLLLVVAASLSLEGVVLVWCFQLILFMMLNINRRPLSQWYTVLLFISHLSSWSICSVWIFTSSFLPILWLRLWSKKKKKRFPHGYAEHYVCSSTTHAFNFLTWKAFPSKETEKQSFSFWHEQYDLHPVCHSVFSSPHDHCVHPGSRPPPPL